MKGSLLLSCPSKVNYLIFVNVIDYAMEQRSLFLKFLTNKMLVVPRAFDELCWDRDVEMHALYLYSAFVIKGRYVITCALPTKQISCLQKKEAKASKTTKQF